MRYAPRWQPSSTWRPSIGWRRSTSRTAPPGAGRRLTDVAGPAIVAALRRASGELIPQPPGDTVTEPGDVPIVMGTDETIDRLEALFTPQSDA